MSNGVNATSDLYTRTKMNMSKVLQARCFSNTEDTVSRILLAKLTQRKRASDKSPVLLTKGSPPPSPSPLTSTVFGDLTPEGLHKIQQASSTMYPAANSVRAYCVHLSSLLQRSIIAKRRKPAESRVKAENTESQPAGSLTQQHVEYDAACFVSN